MKRLNGPVAARYGRLKENNRGFTLLELLVVIVIIGVLAGLAIPAYNSYVDRARITLAVSTLDTMHKSLEGFHVDHGEYPSSINFSTGQDDLGRTVLPAFLVKQIQEDLGALPTYNLSDQKYEIQARARDDDQTVLTLTSGGVTY